MLSLYKKNGEKYVLRAGREIDRDEILFEGKIELCSHGLHASLLKEQASLYAPKESVLTKVKVWGDVVFGSDKLVAQYREIICEVEL